MKKLILISLSALLSGCAFGLKHIDKSKKTSVNWEKVDEGNAITSNSKKDAKKK